MLLPTLMLIIFTTEPVQLKDPVCCYNMTELIAIMERKDCTDLAAKNPNVSHTRVLVDGTCPKQ